MPPLKTDPKEEKRRIARQHIRSSMERYGVKEDYLAVKACMATRTFRGKLKNEPEDFTLGQLWAMSQTLKLTPIQAASIVLGRDITSKEVKEFLMM